MNDEARIRLHGSDRCERFLESTSMDPFVLGDELIDEEEQAMILALISSNRATNGDDPTSPFPDVHALFRHYNHLYFEDRLDFCRCPCMFMSFRQCLIPLQCRVVHRPDDALRRGLRVSYGRRMQDQALRAAAKGADRLHMLRATKAKEERIALPCSQLRPVSDLQNTLLHEMIHAYLFLEGIRDRDAHGPKFLDRMRRINQSGVVDHQRPSEGYNVTVYHTMHAEVDSYRTHWWSCQRCLKVVKRAMNRPPQEADCR